MKDGRWDFVSIHSLKANPTNARTSVVARLFDYMQMRTANVHGETSFALRIWPLMPKFGHRRTIAQSKTSIALHICV